MSNFPEHILPGIKTAACFFSAAFHGDNDVWYLNKAGIRDVILIDIDLQKLTETAEKFGYNFAPCDAFKFLDNAIEKGLKWDLVICDQWSNQGFDVWNLYNKWKLITKKYLVLSVCQITLDEGLKLPKGELMKRSDFLGGVYCHITKI